MKTFQLRFAKSLQYLLDQLEKKECRLHSLHTVQFVEWYLQEHLCSLFKVAKCDKFRLEKLFLQPLQQPLN
jgi:hypothetical protein